MQGKPDGWIFLSEYQFELKHINGKENEVVHALSQWTHMIYEVTLSQTDADLHEKIITANKVDPFYVEILKKVQKAGCFNNKRNTRWMTPDYYGPRIDYMFQMEGTFGPASSQNFIGNPTRGTQDIKRWYLASRDTFFGLS